MKLISLLSYTASLTAERPLTHMTISWCHVGISCVSRFATLRDIAFYRQSLQTTAVRTTALSIALPSP
jgi:hypothetical protein